MEKEEKYYEMTIERFLDVYATMNKKKLSDSEKKNIAKYAIATEIPKLALALPERELLIIREVKKLQLEILDVVGCDKLRILL